jgi:hypothetical protein
VRTFPGDNDWLNFTNPATQKVCLAALAVPVTYPLRDVGDLDRRAARARVRPKGLSDPGDDCLAADAALADRLHGLHRLVEVEDPSDDGAQHAAVDEGSDLTELVAAGAHE